ncbi:MAG: hypothetical protein H6634_01045 [Anaerolineales bacterium]|nr:hypothetical protein [Anaerolineales bacterium]
MKIDLGKILTRSWQIIWNYKVLWIFGIFAGFANSNGGSSNSGGSGSSNGRTPSSFTGNPDHVFGQIQDFFQQHMLIIIAVCAAVVVLTLAFYALGMMGRIGILKGVYKVEGGASSLTFAELWSESMPYFWRFFGMNILVGLAVLVLVLVVMVPFFFVGAATAGLGFLCLLPLICLMIPLAWVVNVIMEQGQAAIVAEDIGIVDGFKRGWEIAKSDIVGMIVLSLVLGIGSGIIGLIIALPIIAAVIPFVFSMINYQTGDTLPVTVWISVACCGIYLPILIGLSGILTAYVKTAWALSYMQLTKAPEPPENTPVLAQVDA